MRARETTADIAEIGRPVAQADAWWNAGGSFRMLQRINPIRLAFIRRRLLDHFCRDPDQLRPFCGLRLLDIGCGGGLIAEPMTRLGFAVTGADAADEAIAAARKHAQGAGLNIDYQVGTADAVAGSGDRYDVVLALEVIEHVADCCAFLGSLGAVLAPGGALIVATINRTVRSFALAIVGAEYVLGWVPRGTHDWRKFLRPSELILGLRRNGLHPSEIVGLSYQPVTGEWALSQDIEVNYLVMARRQE
jgi:2-polyprenyl-6-hydroxyphenyl methylase / 3-demethylubiquinone-9 3-methyltransferase